MFRPMDVTCLADELRRLYEFNRWLGLPVAASRQARMESYAIRNPQSYHLYEVDDQLHAYAGLIPLYPETYHRLLAEGSTAFACVGDDLLLTAREYAHARWLGVWVWIESCIAVDAATHIALGEHIYHCLSEMNLKGLIAGSASGDGEAHLGWLGLQELGEPEGHRTKARKLWYADEAAIAADPEQTPARPSLVRHLFLTVRERFGSPDPLPGLSPAECRVARLFYIEDRKAEEIAHLLHIQPGTVKTHLQRIRDKAEPVVGSRLSRRLTAYFEHHPGALAGGNR